MTYDYIVVGAGIAGLLTGSVLLKRGSTVIVVDKNKSAGGYLQDLSPGIPFGAHHIGIPNRKLLGQFCEELGLSVNQHLRNADNVTVVCRGRKIPLSLNLSEQKEQLTELFPDEAEGICGYYKYLTDFSEVLYSDDDKTVRKYFIELANVTFEKFLEKFFQDEDLIGLLSFIGPSYGGVNKGDSAFTFASLIVTYGSGAYYLDTGWLIDQLEKCVKEDTHGGIRYKFEACSMQYIHENSCYEVTDRSGRKEYGRKIIFAGYFAEILGDYCGRNRISNNALKKIFSMEAGPSAYRFYFRTEKKVQRHEWICMDDIPAIVSALEEDACNVMVTFVTDEKRTKEEYEMLAKKLVAEMLQIEAAEISLVLTSTPEHKLKMTANKGGAVFGWRRSNSNNMTANLIYGLQRYVNNVYVVGNWSATFGFFGVLYTVAKFLRNQSIELKGIPL